MMPNSNLHIMYVYRLVNKHNGKSYVGQTTRSVEERYLEHTKYHLRTGCRKLSNALRKYGVDSFSLELLDTASSLEELNRKERFWIDHFDSIKNGYNLVAGGDNFLMSEETKRKLSRLRKGKALPQAARINSIKNHSVKVHQYDIDGYFIRSFSSAAEAKRLTNIANEEIGKVCKGTKRSAGGFQWSYKKEEKIESARKIVHPKRRGKPTTNKKTALMDVDGKILQIYGSAKEAALHNKCDHSSVVAVCNGKLKTTRGLHFSYLL